MKLESDPKEGPDDEAIEVHVVNPFLPTSRVKNQ
jgi:hypothetical protein